MASKLIKDLEHVPEIVGSLGLSIADAQRALNVDYLDGLQRVIAFTKSLLDDPAVKPAAGANPDSEDEKKKADYRGFLQAMLKQLAPSRYQFSETTLTVRLNLAQRLDVGAQAGIGIGVGAVAVNASMALAYGFDYQAAAECRTVLHAYPADGNVMDKLLARAATLNDKALTLPERHATDAALIEKANGVFTQMFGEAPKKAIKTGDAAAPAPSGGG